MTPFGATFVTGTQGLGHVVLPTMDPAGAFAFYSETLGFLPRGAMRLPAPPEFGPLRIRFFGVNERHHSMALCPAPHGGAPGLVHIMVEVDSLDAVGRALDRVAKAGFSLSSTLGRHTNDKMISFYVRAPGGWDIEFGTDGMKVDERTTPLRKSPPTVTGVTTGRARAVGRDVTVMPTHAGDIASWDVEADVVIAGYGIAGVSAAIEAARAGADVMVLERTGGWGGAAALAGGFVYLGAGTPIQKLVASRIPSTTCRHFYARRWGRAPT